MVLPWAHGQKNAGNNIVARTLDNFTQWKTLVDESDELKLQLGDAWRKDDVFRSARKKYLKWYVPPPLPACEDLLGSVTHIFRCCNFQCVGFEEYFGVSTCKV